MADRNIGAQIMRLCVEFRVSGWPFIPRIARGRWGAVAAAGLASGWPARGSLLLRRSPSRPGRWIRSPRGSARRQDPKPPAECDAWGHGDGNRDDRATRLAGRSWPQLALGHPIVFSTARASSPGLGFCICDRGSVRGGQLEEPCGPAECLPDGVAYQVSLVGLVPRHLPRLPARSK
jgi:hypothetical protein